MPNIAPQSDLKNLCWMRAIRIRLISKRSDLRASSKGYIDIVSNHKNEQLNISINGKKYLSAIKDTCNIDISNLTQATIAEIILGQYFIVEVYAGYNSWGPVQEGEENNLFCFFKGEVAYISNHIQTRRDNTCHILCASKMVASFSQKRMNFSFNSSINLYAAYKYICMTSGIGKQILPDYLKQMFIKEVDTQYCTPANIGDQLANQDGKITIDTDEGFSNLVLNITSLKDKRFINLSPDTILLKDGNPTLDKDGVKLKVIPNFMFKIGDIIKIPNSLINVDETDLKAARENFKTNYIDPDGCYMIVEMDYALTNRGQDFYIGLRGRSLSIIKNITGAK